MQKHTIKVHKNNGYSQTNFVDSGLRSARSAPKKIQRRFQIRKSKAHNQVGPQEELQVKKRADFINLPQGVEERLHNMETHTNLKRGQLEYDSIVLIP